MCMYEYVHVHMCVYAYVHMYGRQVLMSGLPRSLSIFIVEAGSVAELGAHLNVFPGLVLFQLWHEMHLPCRRTSLGGVCKVFVFETKHSEVPWNS